MHLPLASALSPLSSNPHGGGASTTYVAKISMDPRDNEDREIYFRDVEMQTLAKYYAHLFNEYQPPKLVDFVKASILRLEETGGTAAVRRRAVHRGNLQEMVRNGHTSLVLSSRSHGTCSDHLH